MTGSLELDLRGGRQNNVGPPGQGTGESLLGCVQAGRAALVMQAPGIQTLIVGL